MIDQATINKIFDAADIVEVIQDFVPLKKRGTNYMACCPFHDEKTPSFSVSPTKGIFKCFGCGKAGNAVTFVQMHENISFVEALKYVAKKYGIEVHDRELSEEEKRHNDDRESMLVVLDYAQKQFTKTLFDTEEGTNVGLEYFKERDFTMATIKHFQLGYSLKNPSSFSKTALKDGYKKEFLLKTGLCYQRESTGELGDFYAGRVMFPIHSASGKVIAFGGRVLQTDKKVAKYKNSPESEVYVKNKVLYGLFFAKNAIVKKQNCYLVEGYTDVISMYQAGIENIVASCGTSLTTEQVKLIHRFSPNVTVMYDGDSAGIHASLRGIDMLLEEGLNVKVVLLPDGEDPDSFARKNAASEVETFLNENSQDFIIFKSKLLIDESKNDPIKKSQFINDVLQSISVIPDNITRMVYVKECAGQLDIDEASLVAEIKRLRAKKYYGKDYKEVAPLINEKKRQAPIVEQKKETCDNQENEIIYYLLKYGNKILFEREGGGSETVAKYIIGEIDKSEIVMQNELCRKIFDQYKSLLEQNVNFDEKYFINNADEQISQFAVNIFVDEYQLSKIWAKNGGIIGAEESNLSPELEKNLSNESISLERNVPRAITAYKIKILTQAINKFKDELKTNLAAENSETVSIIMKKIMELNDIRKILSKELARITA